MSNAEKIARHSWLTKNSASRARQWLKRQAARLRRRAEKRSPENAPKRCIKGWAD